MSGAPVIWIAAAGVLVPMLLFRFMRWPHQGLYLTIFTSAILITPELPVVREKLTATEFLMLLTWTALLLKSRRTRLRTVPLGAHQRLSIALGGAFITWTFLSFAVNQIWVASTEAFVASAVETANFLYGFLMFCTVVYFVDDWPKLRRCLLAWFAGAAVVAVFGVWAFLGGAPGWTYDDFTGRISSTLRTENQVPMFLMPIVVALVFWAARRGREHGHRVGMLALLAGVLVSVAGSGGRTAFAMTLLAVLATLWLALIEARRRGYRTGLMVNLAIGLVAGVALYVAIALAGYQGDYALGETPAWQRPVVMLYDWLRGRAALDETRPVQLQQAWIYFWEQPLFGTGPKLYGYEYRMAEIHNTYAGVMLQMGLIGIVLFLAWQLHLVWLGWRVGRRLREPFQRLMVLSLWAGMLLLMVYGLTMFGLRQRNLWLLAGLIVATQSLRRRELAAYGPARRRVAAPARRSAGGLEARPLG